MRTKAAGRGFESSNESNMRFSFIYPSWNCSIFAPGAGRASIQMAQCGFRIPADFGTARQGFVSALASMKGQSNVPHAGSVPSGPACKSRVLSIATRAADLKAQSGRLLVDKVAYFREDAVTQFHAQQPRTQLGAQILFKSLKNVSGQIRLLPKHSQQRRAIGWILVVAG